MKKGKSYTCIMAILIVTLFYSCMTTIPYHNMHEINENNQQIYTFNTNKDKALIYIDGSGLSSVLGVKNGDKWTSVQFGYFLANNINSDFTLVIPEKLNFKNGTDHKNDSEALKNYTVENLVESYSNKIDYYIEHNSKVNEIYLLGISEGGLLAPKVLNTIKNKSKIRKMVIWGAGGYSQEECFSTLAISAIQMPETYRNECKRISEVKKDIELNPTAVDKYYLGLPYSRWSSFFNYRPINEYAGIDIPVLFIQGLKDYNSPFESVKSIEEKYNNKNYEYIYYSDMDHIPEKKEDIAKVIQSMYSWIKK